MEKAFYAFGTMNQIQVDDNISAGVLDRMVVIASRLDDLLSVFKPDSEVSKINKNAGLRSVKVSPFTVKLLERAKYYSEISNGAFDVTIRPAVKLWSIGHKEQRIPKDIELNEIKHLVDYRLLEIDVESRNVFLKKEDQAIDLGGIAKGYAGDLIKKKLMEAGVSSGILNFGGTILTIGNKSDGSSWRVGIQNPMAKRGQSVGTIDLNDSALVTSALNERFFLKDGLTYHHLLDPHTLKPAQSGILSVTAAGNFAMDLDALTTALFVLGVDKGFELANMLGINAIYLLNNGEMYATEGFIGKELNFTINNKKSMVE